MKIKMISLKGIPVSPGIAYGKVVFLEGTPMGIISRNILEAEVPDELNRFKRALDTAKEELKEIEKRIGKEVGEETASIFSFQAVMLEDPVIISEIRSEVAVKHINVEAAVSRVIEKYQNMFFKLDDMYIRVRASDIVDVGNRLLNILISREEIIRMEMQQEKGILFGMEFFPSDLVKLKRENVLGIISEIGGATSHAAIIANSMNTPAVIAVKDATKMIKVGDILLLDGYSGNVFVNPDKKTIQKYEKIKHISAGYVDSIDKKASMPAITGDGVKIKLMANVDDIGSIDKVIDFGAEGIGIYRTEYLFIKRDSFPSEEELGQVYRKVAEKIKGREVSIRLMDIGGDKDLSYFKLPKEFNPAMGWKGIRILLEHRDLLEMQTRAILKASVIGNVNILFPMVSTLDEVKVINQTINNIKNDLTERKIQFNRNMKIGIMIETPAAAMNINNLLSQVDFVSVGTNDLVQYLLAVDRNNPKVSKMYEPLDYSVLFLLKNIIRAGKEFHKEVSICGEIAGNPNYTLLLMGLGLETFSMPPMFVPIVKEIIRKSTYKKAREIAEYAIGLHDAAKIRKLLIKETRALIPFIEEIIPG